jgi:glucose-induced degradation protein 8
MFACLKWTLPAPANGLFSSQLLDRDNRLHFSLLRLQLVELIRASFSSTDSSAVAKAIEFAQQNLAPYATLDPQFKNDLERAMALLIVPRESWTSPQSQQQPQSASAANAGPQSSTGNNFGALAELVDPSLRRKVAKDVNEAILQSQGEKREAHIRYLVRARAWAEQLAREKKLDLPEKLSLGLDGDEAEAAGNGERRQGRDSNGHAGAGGDTDMAEDGPEAGAGRGTGGGGGNGGDTVMARYTNIPS